MNIKPIDTNLLRLLWGDGEVTMQDISSRLGISHDTLCKHARELQLEKRPRAVRRSERDPTIEEIEERAAAIRASWSDSERERRYIGQRAKQWTPPRFGRELLCLD